MSQVHKANSSDIEEKAGARSELSLSEEQLKKRAVYLCVQKIKNQAISPFFMLILDLCGFRGLSASSAQLGVAGCGFCGGRITFGSLTRSSCESCLWY